mmetsp:Transcript_29645/g.49140  ORF Transcript_29645/g.49140 Transcript_29645/m.49140 type:complete len:93 (-) Transcript_29645:14-292(-)
MAQQTNAIVVWELTVRMPAALLVLMMLPSSHVIVSKFLTQASLHFSVLIFHGILMVYGWKAPEPTNARAPSSSSSSESINHSVNPCSLVEYR